MENPLLVGTCCSLALSIQRSSQSAAVSSSVGPSGSLTSFFYFFVPLATAAAMGRVMSELAELPGTIWMERWSLLSRPTIRPRPSS